MFPKYLFYYFLLISLIIIAIIIILIIYLNKVVRDVGENKKNTYKFLNERARENSIVFLGDSLTEFYRLDEFFSGINIYNRGIAANTTDDIIERLKENVINISPQKVFLQIGTNDLGKRKKYQKVFHNIIKIIKIIEDELPETEIFILSLYPVNRKAKIYSPVIVGPRKNKNIDKLNRLLKNYCLENNLKFIDLTMHLKDEKGNLKKEYTVDGLHLNSLGYLQITEIISKYVL